MYRKVAHTTTDTSVESVKHLLSQKYSYFTTDYFLLNYLADARESLLLYLLTILKINIITKHYPNPNQPRKQ
jgi:hypothetical protein